MTNYLPSDSNGLLVVVFSYNRALQLDLTLKSLLNNLTADYIEISVIYHTSGDHAAAYAALIEEYKKYNVHFYERCKSSPFLKDVLPYLFNVRNLYRYLKYSYLRNNRDNFKSLLEKLITTSKCKFIMFSTDDNVFYKKQNISKEIYELIMQNPNQTSYRCYVGRNHHNAPVSLEQNGEFLMWNYYDPQMASHWAYPFSVDGTVYEKIALLNVISPSLYHMPTTLEAFIVSNVAAKKLFSKGYGPVCSTMVGVMLNRVANIGNNKSGNYSPQILNKYYLDGYRLNIHLDNININAITLNRICLKNNNDDEVILTD